MKPATIDEIYNFFSSNLNLPDDKVEYFMNALVKSLKSEFHKAEQAIENKEIEKLGSIAHTIKGTLLNSGLSRWAEKAREIEFPAKSGEEKDYSGMLAEMREGLSILLDQ
jgi:HPt (histidine-containing phosphotransfer) domain-containing protein